MRKPSVCLLAFWIIGSTVALEAAEEPLGLDGRCVVCLVESKQWVVGKSEFSTVYDGHRYLFSSDAEKARFLGNPGRYAPVLGGDSIVAYADGKSRVSGSVSHSLLYDGRIYLFSNAGEKQTFVAEPKKYAQADLAWHGDCSVCWVDANRRISGHDTLVEQYKGLRYFFPNAATLAIFRGNPAKYEDRTMVAPSVSAVSAPLKETSLITVRGKSACAVCDFGISPLHAPNELGMAVKTDDGKIYILEDAHLKYPKLYSDRFDGLELAVRGTAIKTEGKVVWLQPEEVKIVN